MTLLRRPTRWPVVALLALGAIALGVYSGFDRWNPRSVAVAGNCTTVDLESQECALDVERLSLGSKIELSVTEEGRTITCTRARSTTDSNWYGECDGDASDANFVLRSATVGEQRHVFGSLHVGNQVCQVSPDSQGTTKVKCINDDVFFRMDPVRDDDIDELGIDDMAVSEEAEPVYSEPKAQFIEEPELGEEARGSDRKLRSTTAGIHAQSRRLYDDSGSTLDILVAWTIEAECRHSDLPEDCKVTQQTEQNIRGLIDLAIEESNVAFELSGINTQFRLVYAYRNRDYSEPTSRVYERVLQDLRSKVDRKLDEVHEKRELYGADMVHLIIGHPGPCGNAFTGPVIDKMFSISRVSCTTGYYSFSHESMHNLGGFHDRGSMNRCNHQSTYNYGWRDPNAEFRDILAYGCKIGECDNMPKDGCKRVQRFSNTQFLYNCTKIGDEMNDSARTINQNLAKVAAYYESMDCEKDTDCNDNSTLTIDRCDTSNRVCVFEHNSLEAFVVGKISSNQWTTVDFKGEYQSPVPVCTVKYGYQDAVHPALVRLRNVHLTSMELRLQNPSGHDVGPFDVHCVVVEEGAWRLPDGRAIEARLVKSTRTDRRNKWVGEKQRFLNKYEKPIVLGQVLTFNDERWSAFWSRGYGRLHSPCRYHFHVGKHTGEDTEHQRKDETLGYIVVEEGFDVSGDLLVQSTRSSDLVLGYGEWNSSFVHPLQVDLSMKPEVAIATQAGMDGMDGSWAVLASLDANNTSLGVAVDEDMIADGERSHTDEEVDVLAFSSSGLIYLTK